MKIEKIDFQDENFRRLIKKYCLSSAPFGEIEIATSLSSRIAAVEKYTRNTLVKSDLSICAKSNSGEYLFFAFFVDEGDKLNLTFAFPNQEVKQTASELRLCFYKICLKAIKKTKTKCIVGLVFRSNKKNAYKIFLKRYIKAMTYIENKEGGADIVYLSKESILKHYEEM